ncbi:MAG: hypothetical protein ACOY94_00690 [Bacillota bacterium]
MELKPVIASYSGESYQAMKGFLDRDALGVVGRVAQTPVTRAELEPSLCDELIEMHVLREADGFIRLDTAVFLEDDIRRVNLAMSQMAAALSPRVMEAAAAMRHEHPVMTNFVVGMLGVGQSLGHLLREAGVSFDWRSYGGKYARSKVDFDQVCEAHAELGEDLQTKTVLRGTRYTAVFIGPGGKAYPLRSGDAGGTIEYIRELNQFLTDAYAMLLTGELENEALRLAAEQAGLVRDGQPESAVLTARQVDRFLPTIERVRSVTHSFYLDQLQAIHQLLASTASGRQGVDPAKMMMHLWRYMRRAIARELYTAGFLTDRAPETGLITVFYEHDVEAVDALLR